MKLIAHRGWSEGRDENTLAAFARAAADSRVSGIEIDICRDTSGTLLVSHDKPDGDAQTLTLDAALQYLAGTDLELFVEVKDAGIAAAVSEKLVAAGVADRSVVFAFADIAESFAWNAARLVPLGAILVYPWRMRRFVDAYRPDVILTGWDQHRKPWTRLAFRAWWSVFPLSQVSRRFRKPVVVGIVRRAADLQWLAHQNVAAAIADMDLISEAPSRPPPP